MTENPQKCGTEPGPPPNFRSLWTHMTENPRKFDQPSAKER